MKKTIYYLLILTLTLTAFSGCGKDSTPDREEAPIESEEPPREEEEPDPAEPEDPQEEPQEPEEDTAQENTAEDTAANKRAQARIRHAYAEVLSGVYYGSILPDGTMLAIDDYSSMEDNRFAVADVDGDGSEELVLYFTTTSSAGMIGCVWEYDPATGSLAQELIEYPSLTFYDNGLLQVDASHNHSMGIEFWPYTLFKYEEAGDTYRLAYNVSSWEKAFSETDYEGNAFPDATDADGDGLVYLVTDGSTGVTTTMDNSDFEAWNQEILAGGTPLELPWENLTYEAITALVAPYMEYVRQDILETAADKDLALLYMDGGLDAVQNYLAADCGVTFTAQDEYEEFFSGSLNGQEVIDLDPLNATAFNYTGAIDGVTALGITPGMDAQEAAAAVTSLGFRLEEGQDFWYVTGSGIDNYGVYLQMENNVVTGIRFGFYCKYVG